MTNINEVIARRNELEVKVASLLTEYADAFAPDVEADGSPCPHDMDEDCPCVPPANLFPKEWLLIAKMTDLDQGGSVIIGLNPSDQDNSHTYGLLKVYEKSRW